jgi:TolB-like protein/DNA-binding SARP family transcriptional activator/Tfp pilus assembly protein PilF
VACRLALLGGFCLQDGDGADLVLTTRKDRLLLAYLALSPARSHGRDRLAGLLWGDRGDAQARDSLRQSLAALRTAFRRGGIDPLRTDREQVTLEPSGISIDAAEFAELVRMAPARAVSLYCGELLEGLEGSTPEFDEWLRPERQRLRDLAIRALEMVISTDVIGEGLEAGIALGRRLIAKDRLQEGVYCALMRLYALKGDRAEALKLYLACRDALQQELGIGPAPKTDQVYREILAEPAPAPIPPPREPEPASGGLSIAVLPFNNMSGDPQQQYFSDGFTEDIITELSRFRSLRVVARNSSFAYRAPAVDVRKVGQELGVRFVVEGSMRRAGDQIRISAQLLETAGGNHLWAERYDRAIDDLFAIQDEVVRTIVATIATRLEASEISGARRRTGNMAAYDCLLRGIEHALGYGLHDNRLARELFERAIALDPDYALAHAYRALGLMMEHGYANAPEPIKLMALESGQKGVRLDPNDARCHQFLSQVYLYLARHDEALFHQERSLALNPSDPHGIVQYGFVLAQIGRAKEGIDWIRRAMRLNPAHPPWYWADLAVALYADERFEEALEANKRVSAGTAWQHARLAACYAKLGRLEEARAETEEVLRLDPNFHLSKVAMAYKFPADRDRVLDGMRRAGLPD